MSQKTNDTFHRMLQAAALSRAICSIAELGVADLIPPGQPQSVEHLASASKTHELSLYRVLRYLAGNGVFHETHHRHFDHTELSAALRSDRPDSFRGGARMFHHLFAGWDGLHHSLLTGEPGFAKVFGSPVFDYIQAHPEMGPIFDAGMSSLNFYETSSMLDVYDFSGIQVLADIGGGNGSLLSAILARYPALKGILFDLGHVISRAKENLKKAGLDGRCVVQEGSFFETVPAGADTYLFRHIIHDWTDAQCAQILGHCRKVIPSHGKLLVADCVVPAGNEPSPTKDLDMTMLAFPGGRERTESEFRVLLKGSGFELKSITPTTTAISIVEARPV